LIYLTLFHLPLKTNSKRVFKFSGLGLETYMIEYPKATAAAMASPNAADFPRPLAAVNDTIGVNFFSDIHSINLRTASA